MLDFNRRCPHERLGALVRAADLHPSVCLDTVQAALERLSAEQLRAMFSQLSDNYETRSEARGKLQPALVEWLMCWLSGGEFWPDEAFNYPPIGDE